MMNLISYKIRLLWSLSKSHLQASSVRTFAGFVDFFDVPRLGRVGDLFRLWRSRLPSLVAWIFGMNVYQTNWDILKFTVAEQFLQTVPRFEEPLPSWDDAAGLESTKITRLVSLVLGIRVQPLLVAVGCCDSKPGDFHIWPDIPVLVWLSPRHVFWDCVDQKPNSTYQVQLCHLC